MSKVILSGIMSRTTFVTLLVSGVLLMGSAEDLAAQTKTTEALQAKFQDDVFSAYLYKNTLRMLNQKENKEFDELIKNIEKMKFLIVKKEAKGFGAVEYKKLKSDYMKENYESIMTSRHQGRNFDIYINDKRGSTPGTVVLVNDSSNLYVLDMIGTIDMTKVGTLFSTIDESADIGKRMQDWVRRGKHDDDEDERDSRDKDKKKDSTDH